MYNKKILAGIAIIIVAIAASVTLTLQTFETAFTSGNTSTANPEIGLVINAPSSSADISQIREIYSQAATTGIGRNNLYLFWNMIEPEKEKFDWKQSDILMRLNQYNNLDVTLYFSLINGKTLGPFPDWIGKPSLISINDDQVVRTLDAILTRYYIIDTVIIAGETDEHFRYNEQNISVYKELFENIYTKLKQKHPNVQIGNAYSLHGVINKDLDHIVTDLNTVGDFVGFTYFPTDVLNDIIKTPAEAKQDLEHALVLADNKKIAFFETSWSTSNFVNGNENDQREFIKKSFEFYNENESEIEFMTWYRQYDKPTGSCAFAPQLDEEHVTIGGGSGLGSSEHVVERLDNYICNSGLLDVDGTAKPGWNEFKRQIGDLSATTSSTTIPDDDSITP